MSKSKTAMKIFLGLACIVVFYYGYLEAVLYPDLSAELSTDVSRISVQMEDGTVIHVPVNINTADLSELMTLPYIDEANASAIIEYRESYGDFVSVKELISVNGIGEALLEKLTPYITV